MLNSLVKACKLVKLDVLIRGVILVGRTDIDMPCHSWPQTQLLYLCWVRHIGKIEIQFYVVPQVF